MSDLLNQVQDIFGAGGPMEQKLPDFTCRAEQMRFANAVAEAFQDELFLVAEAGTGVGKTFAYLIPALLWSQQNREKVVISTKTKALQQQIVDRDLPQLEQVVGFKLNYVEAKGRENYLCWHKYQSILGGRRKLEKEQLDFIQAILTWGNHTKSGDRKELNLKQELMQHWEIVAADRNSCQRELCKYRDKCFRLKMNRRMGAADLIIVNHALLLSDVMVDHKIMPQYHHLIIDEAHTFSKETFDRFALRFSLYDTLRLLRMLYIKDRRSKKGYLFHLRSSFPQLAEQLDGISLLVDKAIKLTSQIFDRFSAGLKHEKNFNFSHILNSGDRERPWMADVLEIYDREWKPNLELLLFRLEELAKELELEEEGHDLAGIINTLQEIDDTAFTIMEETLHSSSIITWLEFSAGKAIAICAAEVNTAGKLAEKLYSNLQTLVMVSATLAVGEDFGNFITRSGLQEFESQGRLKTHLEQSPFDYQQQACLYVIKDMPDPSSAKFNHAVNRVLADIFVGQGGQTMALFTSSKQLQETSSSLRPYCEQQGLNLLVQNEDGEFASLLEKFVTQPHSILMGLETFWEGIDLKGDLLKCLIIVKLPFRSPSDPYCSAWDRFYQQRRKNSFQYFMLPDAALRFKQGIGRLIRSENDRGTVVVLDTRLIYRKYGTVFQDSIPIKNIISLPMSELGSHEASGDLQCL